MVDNPIINYTDINAQTIDRWIEQGWEWGIPISHEDFENVKNGTWDVLLTPTKPVPKEWFPRFDTCKILGLAAGGGQQMPVFAALGADCTVLDYSQKQIDTEYIIAQREGYNIKILKSDMTHPLPFGNDSFDVIFHPVSNCYIEDVMHVWRECYRILKKGGLLMSGLDNGINFAFDDTESKLVHTLPFNPLRNPALYNADDGVQFSHTLDEQIRGQIRYGFVLRDLYEDYNESGPLRDHGIPSFWATLAVKN